MIMLFMVCIGCEERESNLDLTQQRDTQDSTAMLDEDQNQDLGVDLQIDLGDIDSPPSRPHSSAITPYDPLDLVDPFIATGGNGAEVASVTPGASTPLGLTLIGPDTRSLGGQFPPYHCAGYHYADSHIQGFSHTHAHGIGIVDYGGISLMPRASWRDEYRTLDGRSAPFSHATEEATPGFYHVHLDDDLTEVNLVATPHGAHHLYHFEPEQNPVVILNLDENLNQTQTRSASIWVNDEDLGDIRALQVLAGQYSQRFGGVHHYAALRFDPSPLRVHGWIDDGEMIEGRDFNGSRTGLVLHFPQGTTEVHVRVGLSFVDFEGAQLNLETELPDLDQSQRLLEAEEQWRSFLERVRVRGNPEDMTRFTTAHYHSLLMPSINSDVDGRYRGLDQEIHSADFEYYSNFSLWDTYRTLHSFYVLAHPQLQLNLLKSLVQMSKDGGSLPRWPLAHGYTGGMIGSPASIVFADSYLKGLDQGWDVEHAFQVSLDHASGIMPDANRKGIEEYLSLGWVPADVYSRSVSLTLEYAWADYALAEWGSKLQHPASSRLYQQASSWESLWDAQSQFMIGRTTEGQSTWRNRPFGWEDLYVEGNAWHYLWFVPYNVSRLIEVQHQGNQEAFLNRLSTYWQNVYNEDDDLLPDDYYWHGNEPVMHYAWLGSLAGNLESTVEASHWILAHRYGLSPEKGLDGNDDSGTLSAWYLWASMGIYPIAGTEQYALGAPLFNRVEIDLDPLHLHHDRSLDEHMPTMWILDAPQAGWNRVPHSFFKGDQNFTLPQISHRDLLRGFAVNYQ